MAFSPFLSFSRKQFDRFYWFFLVTFCVVLSMSQFVNINFFSLLLLLHHHTFFISFLKKHTEITFRLIKVFGCVFDQILLILLLCARWHMICFVWTIIWWITRRSFSQNFSPFVEFSEENRLKAEQGKAVIVLNEFDDHIARIWWRNSNAKHVIGYIISFIDNMLYWIKICAVSSLVSLEFSCVWKSKKVFLMVRDHSNIHSALISSTRWA